MYQLFETRDPLGIPYYYSGRRRGFSQAILTATRMKHGHMQDIEDGYKEVGPLPSPPPPPLTSLEIRHWEGV